MDVQKKVVRVLIVDDCPIARELISGLLAEDSGIQLVGEACNGAEGVRQAARLRPDLIIMDIEMPVMNGLEAIAIIMQDNPTPIIVVTAYHDAYFAYEAISRGALEVVEKPNIDFADSAQFIHKLKLLTGVKVIKHISRNRQTKATTAIAKTEFSCSPKAIAIASSLGGAKVLETLFSQLPADFPVPIVVAQHISEGFAEPLAEWLNYKTPLSVKVASQDDSLLPGSVLISPPEYNMQVAANGHIDLLPSLPEHIYHPSCDILLSSVARSYQRSAIGIILTGMGQDGVVGIQAIKTAGGITIAQNEQTSLIYNMPRLAIERGLADYIVAANDISATLIKVISLCQ